MWKLIKKIKSIFTPDPEPKFWKNREKALHPHGMQKSFYHFYIHSGQKILNKFNAFIPTTEEIKPFATPHSFAGIFIAQNAVIGEGCTIFHQVTIGSNTLRDSKGMGAPVIGNNVYIGAGAKIIGKVTVGNNVRIGANAVITTDIPDNATVVLESPRIIMHESPRDNTFEPWRNVTK